MSSPDKYTGAFPQTPVLSSEGILTWPESYGLSGMALRDYFAAKALVGLLAKLPLVDMDGEHGQPVADKIAHNRDIAESCYWLADAMMVARNAALTANGEGE